MSEMEATEQFPRCGECGGLVMLWARSGRTREYITGIWLDVPDDYQIPTCVRCGNEYMSPEFSEPLDKIIGQRFCSEMLLARPYARVFVPEASGGFSARMLEFPGCFAQGETLDEAYQNLERAAESWLLATLEAGQAPPLPLQRC